MLPLRNLIVASVCLVSLSLVTLACGKQAEEGGKILARYNGGTITQVDLDQEINKYPPQVRTRYQTPRGKKDLLDRTIERRLMVKAAQERGLDQDPEYLQRIEEMKERLLTDSLRRTISSEDFEVTDQEVEKYYQEHEKQYHTPNMVRVRNLLVKTESEAKKILQEAREGKTPFPELVAKYSQDETTKRRGGDTGFFAEGSRDPALEEAAFKLEKEKDLSGVVKTDQGYHILQLIGKRPEVTRTLDQVRDEIKRRIKFERRREAFDDFIKQEKEKAQVEIFEEALQPSPPSSK